MNSQEYRDLSEAYLDVYENEQLDEMPYRVVTKNNDGEEVYVGGKYSTRKTARTKANRGDETDGGVTHTVRKVDEAIRNPESRKKLRAIMDREVVKGDKSKGQNPRMKYHTKKGDQALGLLIQRDETGSKGNPVRSRGGTNAPADERVGRGPHRAGNAAYWASNAGPTRDRGTGNKAARRAGKSVPNTRDVDESYDLYDLILSHLIDEGYADTNENALVIMANMSEEWREDILDEGIGSAIRGLFGKKKEPEVPAPQSRGAELRAKYNTGPEKTETSVKRKILDKTRERAERDEKEYGDSTYSKSVATKSREAHDKYLRAGYNKYGADRPDSGGMGGSGGSGRGSKAAKRAAALNNSYEPDLFDVILEYLIDEGYADTNENALVIMANMSEDWRESIMEVSDRKVAAVGRRRQANVDRAMDSDEYISDKPGATQKLATAVSQKTRFDNLNKKRERRGG